MLAFTRKLISFLNACFLSALFSLLLIATNALLAKTVAAAPCETLTEQTCSHEDYSKRKRAILEFAGRCLMPELALNPTDVNSVSFESQYLRYIRALERRLLARPLRTKRFFAEVKGQLIQAIESEPKLSAKKKAEYRARVARTTLLLPADHVARGGSEEFRKTCGELGLEENASFVVFGTGETHVMICPGRMAAAIAEPQTCGRELTLDTQSLLYTFAHELGHSVGGNFAEFDSSRSKWVVKNDPVFQPFHQCMKGKFASYPQKDYGEAAADFWAAQAMAGVLKDRPDAAALAKRSLAGLCGTRLTSRHLPGSVRIGNLIAGQEVFRSALGCESAKSQSWVTCSL